MITGNRLTASTLPSTNGQISLPLDDGKWTVLYIYEGDFSPSSASDILALEKALPKFFAYDANVIAMSSDSVAVHLAWILSLRNQSRQGKSIAIELVSDKNGVTQNALGIDAGNESAILIIDPNGVVRHIKKGDTASGINVTEIERELLALQEISEKDIRTPANWTPGAETLSHPPTTLDGALGGATQALKTGGFCADWYICYNDTTLKT